MKSQNLLLYIKAFSDDAALLGISTVKGTTHIFSLAGNNRLQYDSQKAIFKRFRKFTFVFLRPEPIVPATFDSTTSLPVKTVNAVARIHLGAWLVSEGLHPKVQFRSRSTVCVATMAGKFPTFFNSLCLENVLG